MNTTLALTTVGKMHSTLKRNFNLVLAVLTLNDRQRRSGSYFGLKKNSGQGSRDEDDRFGTEADQVRPAISDSGHYIVG